MYANSNWMCDHGEDSADSSYGKKTAPSELNIGIDISNKGDNVSNEAGRGDGWAWPPPPLFSKVCGSSPPPPSFALLESWALHCNGIHVSYT